MSDVATLTSSMEFVCAGLGKISSILAVGGVLVRVKLVSDVMGPESRSDAATRHVIVSPSARF